MRGRRRWVLLGAATVALIIGTIAALVAARYYPAYSNALAGRADLRDAQALLRDARLDASATDLLAAEAKLSSADGHLRGARQVLDDPLLRLGQRLPLIGQSLQATVELTDIGIEGVQVGRAAIEMTRSYQEMRDTGTGTLPERTDMILAEMDPSMATLEERLDRIREKRDRLTGAALPPALVGAVQEMDRDLEELRELGDTYDALSAFLPDFLGFNGPRTYLLLAQNNAELLPTGGLISVYGLITVVDGRVQEKRFEDAVGYGGRWMEGGGAYIEPPAPLERYLLKDFSWNLSVSNWSPHYPTSAQEAERFFRLAGGPPVDGVIAINVHTIEELLRVTGPITVEPYGVTVTAENALEVIEENTRSAQEAETERKAFVGVLAEELLSSLMHVSADQWTPLIETLQRLRDQRHILFFTHDEKMQSLTRRLGLDGALQSPDGDYLMLVDASVNSTKLNIVLDQRVDLTVRIDGFGSAHHRAAISYRNDLPAWSQGRDALLVQRLMLGGLYGGYVRLFTPLGSQPESVTLSGREVGPEEIGTEQDKTVFGRFFALPSGQATELVIQYTTPFAVQSEDDVLEYRLYLQKQPGTGAIPVSIALVLPDGARLDSATLDGVPLQSADRIETDLEVDRELTVRYRLD